MITVRLVQDERGGFGWPADLQPPRRQTSSWRALRNRAVNTPSAYPPPAKADVLSSRQLFSRYQALHCTHFTRLLSSANPSRIKSTSSRLPEALTQRATPRLALRLPERFARSIGDISAGVCVAGDAPTAIGRFRDQDPGASRQALITGGLGDDLGRLLDHAELLLPI